MILKRSFKNLPRQSVRVTKIDHEHKESFFFSFLFRPVSFTFTVVMSLNAGKYFTLQRAKLDELISSCTI